MKSIYKYFNINDFSIDALKKRSVWLSSPTNFNDPYDCGLSIDYERLRKEEDDYFRLMFRSSDEKDKEKAIRMGLTPGWVISVAKCNMEEYFGAIGICSFSESKLNLLLWAHYADKHKGFCVEYDCSDGSKLKELLERVNYVNDIPSITHREINNSGDGEGRKRYFSNLALIKSTDWQYEKEWRLIQDYQNQYYRDELNIKAIYLGTRFDSNNKDLLINALGDTSSKIQIKQIEKKKSSFELYVKT